MNKKHLALYGLKYNPFSPDVPVEALYRTPKMESFCWRLEQLVGDGGFALITGYEKGLLMERREIFFCTNRDFRRLCFPLFNGMCDAGVTARTGGCTCQVSNCLPITRVG
jgi:hypothetical protein